MNIIDTELISRTYKEWKIQKNLSEKPANYKIEKQMLKITGDQENSN